VILVDDRAEILTWFVELIFLLDIHFVDIVTVLRFSKIIFLVFHKFLHHVLGLVDIVIQILRASLADTLIDFGTA
jgi:hypothetical protein